MSDFFLLLYLNLLLFPDAVFALSNTFISIFPSGDSGCIAVMLLLFAPLISRFGFEVALFSKHVNVLGPVHRYISGFR